MPKGRVAAGLRRKALDGAHDVVEADHVSVEHRSAAIQRESITGQVDDVDVGCAQRDAFLDDARALVHQRIDAAVYDFAVGDLARRDSAFLAIVDDHRIDHRVGQRIATTRRILVPAHSGLLPETSQFAQLVGDLRVHDMRLLDVAAFADVPADVVAGQIAHAKRAHRHPEFLQCAIDLLRRGTFLQQEESLPQVLLDHPVADEAVAHPGYDRGLADLLGHLHHRRHHVGRGLLAAHDFEQFHHVRWAEEMQADDILRTASEGGDAIDVERRRIGRHYRAGLHARVQLLEHRLLDCNVLEDRFDHEVGMRDVAVRQGRREQRHRLFQLFGRQLALFQRAFIVPADGRKPLVERLLLCLQYRHREAGVQEIHRDAATHRTGTDDGDAFDLARHGTHADAGNLRRRALGKKRMAQRARLRGQHELRK